MIAAGSLAPQFTLPDSTGNPVSLSEYKGKKVLLVFYPGDNTPVCTKQLCGYRENFDKFTEKGITILAISTDSVSSHKSFSEGYQFPFTLLSDEQKEVCRAFDALSFLGMAQRAYVLLDESQHVVFSFSEALPLFHRTAEELLAKL